MALLDTLSIRHLVSFFELHDSETKQIHFRNLVQKSGFNYTDMIFFDDNITNVHHVMPLGVNVVLVDEFAGTTWKDVLLGWKLYFTKFVN